jgi:thymidylate synthase
MNLEELKYLELLRNIIDNGSERGDRTGTGTKSIFGTNLRFSLEDNTLPLLTTKKVFFKGVVEELLLFLRGETDTKKLEAKGVNIWKGNTSREFLDSRGLKLTPEGDMGLGYGAQWRDFNGTSNKGGVDQISKLIEGIRKDPCSRRHLVSAWNPSQEHLMALPPCHYSFQMYVDNGKLSCMFNMRSVDTLLGLPFNIGSYALLTHIIAKTCDLTAKELIFSGADTHVYINHIDAAKIQLGRVPYSFPKIEIMKSLSSINDIENLAFEDFELNDYNCHPAIKAVMAI